MLDKFIIIGLFLGGVISSVLCWILYAFYEVSGVICIFGLLLLLFFSQIFVIVLSMYNNISQLNYCVYTLNNELKLRKGIEFTFLEKLLVIYNPLASDTLIYKDLSMLDDQLKIINSVLTIINKLHKEITQKKTEITFITLDELFCEINLTSKVYQEDLQSIFSNSSITQEACLERLNSYQRSLITQKGYFEQQKLTIYDIINYSIYNDSLRSLLIINIIGIILIVYEATNLILGKRQNSKQEIK